MRIFSFTGIALVGALFGTVVQALLALRSMQEQEPLTRSPVTIYDMKREVPRRRPVRRWRHRQVVRSALQESPSEASAYRRLRWSLWSWSVLATGSLMALVGHVIGS